MYNVTAMLYINCYILMSPYMNFSVLLNTLKNINNNVQYERGTFTEDWRHTILDILLKGKCTVVS